MKGMAARKQRNTWSWGIVVGFWGRIWEGVVAVNADRAVVFVEVDK